MNVQSKEFWLKVKEEYRPEYSPYICSTSPTFKSAWHSKDRCTIESNAELFSSHELGFILLYLIEDKVTKIQVRKDFIDHMINKYS